MDAAKFVLLSEDSCCFVDRTLAIGSNTIHEATRSNTKQLRLKWGDALRLPIGVVGSVDDFNQP